MVVIIDYGLGNLKSIQNQLKRIGHDAKISSVKEDIEQAEKLILPGVGHFAYGMKNLQDYGLIDILNIQVLERKIPILGICLGMQLFTNYSEEGSVNGLGWIKANTIKFNTEYSGMNYKIPHMGWNTIRHKKESVIFWDIDMLEPLYFVHSYYVDCHNKSDILATTTYGKTFVSGIQKDNIFGFQCHPEKSHKVGIKILKNFIERV